MKMIPALIWLALTVACTGADKPASYASEMDLRTYQVPPGMAESVKNIMNNNFHLQAGDSMNQVAKVSVLPNDLLVVLGTPEIHKGFSALVEDLGNHKPTPPENLIVELWAVVGMDQAEGNTTPAVLAPAIAALKQNDGPQHFQVLEKLSMIGSLGDNARVSGLAFEMNASLNKSGTRYVAELRLQNDFHGGILHTRLYLDPDKLVVIGQNDIRFHEDLNNPVAEKVKNWEQNLSMFYILRVTTD